MVFGQFFSSTHIDLTLDHIYVQSLFLFLSSVVVLTTTPIFYIITEYEKNNRFRTLVNQVRHNFLHVWQSQPLFHFISSFSNSNITSTVSISAIKIENRWCPWDFLTRGRSMVGPYETTEFWRLPWLYITSIHSQFQQCLLVLLYFANWMPTSILVSTIDYLKENNLGKIN